jgi:hypothetical protein
MDHTQLPESGIQDVEKTGWDGFPPDQSVGGMHNLENQGVESAWEWHPPTPMSIGYWTEGTITCWPHEMNQYHYKGVA